MLKLEKTENNTEMVQKGGSRSTNVQVQTVNVSSGLTYVDVKHIAEDVFKQNYLTLSTEAGEIARERAEEITNKFIEKLKKENPEGIKQVKDPDFQFSLFELQKEYAKYGEDDLGELLVNLLVSRTKENGRNIRQIVLDEAIKVASTLTKEQIDTLSIIFLLRHTVQKGIGDLYEFEYYLKTHFLPFVDNLSKNETLYRHLEFARCGKISALSVEAADVFKFHYQGLFSRGFTQEHLNSLSLSANVINANIMKSFRNEKLLQVKAMKEEDLTSRYNRSNWTDDERKKVTQLFEKYTMSNDEIEKDIINRCTFMEKVFDVWGDSDLKKFELTSVGITIGYSNVRRIISHFTNLSVWIN